MTYIKKPDCLAIINNDEEQLLAVIAARQTAKEFNQLRDELAYMRKEFDQLKLIVLDLKNG